MNHMRRPRRPRLAVPVLGLMTLLAACAPKIPDSGAGVGFEDYDTYLEQQRARDAALSAPIAQPPAAPGAIAQGPIAQGPVVQVQPRSPEQQTAQAALEAVGFEPTPQVITQVVSPAPAAVDPNNPNLSDEQDFQAVSQRQTIQSDAQRRQAQSAQYQVVAPTAVPERPEGTGSTPLEFAMRTSHPVGQRMYRRGFGASQSRAERACRGYSSEELAQDAFLQAGGPDRDRLGLDPDGDGYACRWDPQVYRNAVRANSGTAPSTN